MRDEALLAIGIDLGTTNSVVSVVRQGQLEVIPDEHERYLHSSVVAFLPSGDCVVGLKARLRRLIDPANTIFSAKRLIGQPFSTPAIQEAIGHLPYQVEGDENMSR